MAETYQSSRFSSGNLLFPATVSAETDGIHYRKGRLLGSSEEVIGYRQIASVKVDSGILWATLRIETSGGSQPVVIHGLGKDDAKAIRDSVRRMQADR